MRIQCAKPGIKDSICQRPSLVAEIVIPFRRTLEPEASIVLCHAVCGSRTGHRTISFLLVGGYPVTE